VSEENTYVEVQIDFAHSNSVNFNILYADLHEFLEELKINFDIAQYFACLFYVQ
jgi:prepilin-type processing-associated H-X9-DG protein